MRLNALLKIGRCFHDVRSHRGPMKGAWWCRVQTVVSSDGHWSRPKAVLVANEMCAARIKLYDGSTSGTGAPGPGHVPWTRLEVALFETAAFCEKARELVIFLCRRRFGNPEPPQFSASFTEVSTVASTEAVLQPAGKTCRSLAWHRLGNQ